MFLRLNNAVDFRLMCVHTCLISVEICTTSPNASRFETWPSAQDVQQNTLLLFLPQIKTRPVFFMRSSSTIPHKMQFVKTNWATTLPFRLLRANQYDKESPIAKILEAKSVLLHAPGSYEPKSRPVQKIVNERSGGLTVSSRVLQNSPMPSIPTNRRTSVPKKTHGQRSGRTQKWYYFHLHFSFPNRVPASAPSMLFLSNHSVLALCLGSLEILWSVVAFYAGHGGVEKKRRVAPSLSPSIPTFPI